jgi:phage terminase large subunit GpA-like protein
MLLDACALMRPPEKLDIAEWADKYGMLSAEGSAMPGKWYTSNAEYQREPMRVLSPGTPYQEVVLCWASQVGKTQIVLFLAAYHIEHDPAPILFVEPDENLCKVISNDRITPMVRDTPRLKAIFDGVKGKKDAMHKPFPGGQLTFAWASSPAQMASRPIRILVTDEEGRYDKAANKEGDPVQLGRKRMATFRNRKHARVSSPNLRRTCSITKAFEASDQRYYYVPCPQCGHMQTLVWEQVKWPEGRPEDAFYVCESFGCEITEADKFTMVRDGEWRAHNPGARTAGFHLNALYSTIGYTWAEIAADYLKAQGIPSELQVFTNTVLALPWDEEAEGADLNELQKRVEEYPAPAPAWCIIVTCGADVQPDRIEATKWGWGLDQVSGALEHRIFYGATSNARGGAWAEFDAWRRLRVQHESGLDLPVGCTFVDSGDGNRTQAVYEYCRAHEAGKVFACKGSSLRGAPLASEAKRVGKQKTLLVMVGSSTAKDMIFSRLKITDPEAPGYIHFPSGVEAGCGKEYFEHLTAEALVTRQTRSGAVSTWEKLSRRNEALDCAVYAYAAQVFAKAKLPLLARQLALKAAKVAPELLAARQAAWAQRAAQEATWRSSIPPSTSPASSPASPLPPERRRRPKARVLRRPGADWIRSPLG